MRKPVNVICEQQRRRSACASRQSDQRLCCSLPRLYNTSSFYIRNFKPLPSFRGYAGQFESHLVRNPEDRFSRDEAHMVKLLFKWAASWQNQQNDCAPSEDSDQPGHPPSLIRVFAVSSMGSKRTQGFFMRTTKTLIKLGGCPGWFESSLGAHAILLVLSGGGSIVSGVPISGIFMLL